MMPRDLILFPVFSLLLLVFAVSFRFLFLNIAAVRKREVRPKVYQTFVAPQMPEKNLLAMNNVSNLFEMPVFFYVAAAFLYASDSVDLTFLILSWAFVFVRIIHTGIHVTYNHVMHRLAAFMISNFILLAIWIRLVIQAWHRI